MSDWAPYGRIGGGMMAFFRTADVLRIEEETGHSIEDFLEAEYLPEREEPDYDAQEEEYE